VHPFRKPRRWCIGTHLSTLVTADYTYAAPATDKFNTERSGKPVTVSSSVQQKPRHERKGVRLFIRTVQKALAFETCLAGLIQPEMFWSTSNGTNFNAIIRQSMQHSITRALCMSRHRNGESRTLFVALNQLICVNSLCQPQWNHT
jgi:hypothetical protein